MFEIVKKACYQNFRQHMDKVLADYITEETPLSLELTRNIFFGNYIEPDADPKIYDEVSKSLYCGYNYHVFVIYFR